MEKLATLVIFREGNLSSVNQGWERLHYTALNFGTLYIYHLFLKLIKLKIIWRLRQRMWLPGTKKVIENVEVHPREW